MKTNNYDAILSNIYLSKKPIDTIKKKNVGMADIFKIYNYLKKYYSL